MQKKNIKNNKNNLKQHRVDNNHSTPIHILIIQNRLLYKKNLFVTIFFSLNLIY